jgi:hypothetical protein
LRGVDPTDGESIVASSQLEQRQALENRRHCPAETLSRANIRRSSRTHRIYGAHNYTKRIIRSIEGVTVLATTQSLNADQTNQSSSGTAGIRLRAVRPLTLSIEGGIDRAGTPFTAISCSKYRVFGRHARYLDAAYFKLHLNTLDSIAGYLEARFELQRRADQSRGLPPHTGYGRGARQPPIERRLPLLRLPRAVLRGAELSGFRRIGTRL